jgi:hypothetical protein
MLSHQPERPLGRSGAHVCRLALLCLHLRIPAYRAPLRGDLLPLSGAARLRLPHATLPAYHYALRGLRLDAVSFLSDPRRGLATAMASLLAIFLPDTLRLKIFA